MLAIQACRSQKCTPNLLPARLNRNGPVNDTAHYWQPTKDEKGKHHAYFRGRHLHGTPLPLPTNYTGAILRITDNPLPQTQSQSHKQTDNDQMETDDEEECTVDVKIAEKVGEFEDMVVWGHGGEVEKGKDAFVRGVEEWVGFAEAIHVDEEEKKV